MRTEKHSYFSSPSHCFTQSHPKAIYPFAKERSELLDVWKETSSAGIEVDLIYGARAWEVRMTLARPLY